MKKLILSAMLLGGLMASCQKETEKPEPKDEIAKTWKFYQFSMIGPMGDTMTFSKTQLANSTAVFQKDGLYVYSIPLADIKDRRSTWELNSKGTMLTFNKDTDSSSIYHVRELNTFMLKIENADPRTPGTITYIPENADEE